MKLRGRRRQLRELLDRAGINTAREQQRIRQNYRETVHHPLPTIPPPGWLWFHFGPDINVTPQKYSTQHVWVGNSPDFSSRYNHEKAKVSFTARCPDRASTNHPDQRAGRVRLVAPRGVIAGYLASG